jgi:hypothetical protein
MVWHSKCESGVEYSGTKFIPNFIKEIQILEICCRERHRNGDTTCGDQRFIK